MSDQMTSEATRNAISSQVSVGGALQLDLLDGLTGANSGAAVSPASLTALQERASARKTSAISARTSKGSSQPADPQSMWESRLRQRLGAIGSTECILTWKASATPAGRSLSRLVPSIRPIDEIDFGLWPTPTSLAKAKDGNNEAGNSAGLVAIRKHALWATASARDWKDSPGMATTGVNPDGSTRNRLDQLPRQAALYPTPKASAAGPDFAKADRSATGMSLPTIAVIQQLGAEPSGPSAQTEKPGALNPAFVCWLMGFPPEWENCAPTAMPSSRRSRQK